MSSGGAEDAGGGDEDVELSGDAFGEGAYRDGGDAFGGGAYRGGGDAFGEGDNTSGGGGEADRHVS